MARDYTKLMGRWGDGSESTRTEEIGETEDRKRQAESEFQCLNGSGISQNIAILALRWYDSKVTQKR